MVRRVVWQDAHQRWTVDGVGPEYGSDDPRVTTAAFYLEREAVPQRIILVQDLASRSITQHEAQPGSWAAMVGG